MTQHYFVPYTGDGVAGDPYRTPEVDDADLSPEEYRRHHQADEGVVLAAVEPVEHFEDLADGSESGVTRLDPAEGEFAAPDQDDEEFPCEECDEAFDSQAALTGHQNAHSDDG